MEVDFQLKKSSSNHEFKILKKCYVSKEASYVEFQSFFGFPCTYWPE